MDIKQAKKQIKNAVIAYCTRNEYGEFRITVSKQRPVFLIGAPGIGKTAIVEQIAKELDLAFVSYSMTHHTRQSALGLPFIADQEYEGTAYKVSEYTMSEIIASVYDEMKRTGKKDGILFLDEINCVSETLAPSMLQFLQYKTFGRHQIPAGWIVVTAGNPPAYNRSVREFDVAMLDRLKKIEVEPDFETWKEFAVETHVHPSVLSYLTIKPNHFYSITSSVDGMQFVTARGWDDLSQMIMLYEINGLEADIDLFGQYLQDEKIAKDFANYYALFRKYQSDYQIGAILDGTAEQEIKDRVSAAKFDERLSLLSLLLSQLNDDISPVVHRGASLKAVLKSMTSGAEDTGAQLRQQVEAYMEQAQKTDGRDNRDTALDTMMVYRKLLYAYEADPKKETVRDVLKNEVSSYNTKVIRCQEELDNAFRFLEETLGSGQEMLIFVTELSINPITSQFIFEHGCEKYYEHNKRLMFENKQDELTKRIDALHLSEVESTIS